MDCYSMGMIKIEKECNVIETLKFKKNIFKNFNQGFNGINIELKKSYDQYLEDSELHSIYTKIVCFEKILKNKRLMQKSLKARIDLDQKNQMYNNFFKRLIKENQALYPRNVLDWDYEPSCYSENEHSKVMNWLNNDENSFLEENLWQNHETQSLKDQLNFKEKITNFFRNNSYSSRTATLSTADSELLELSSGYPRSCVTSTDTLFSSISNISN